MPPLLGSRLAAPLLLLAAFTPPAADAAPCLLQTSTEYVCTETLGNPEPLQPSDCCDACVKNSDCQSWTVMATQQSTQCTLFSVAGADQQPQMKTGDVRYKSGYLPATEHPNAGKGGGTSATAGVFLVSLAVMGGVYLILGVGVTSATEGSLTLPHAAFWGSLGGLVVDGLFFTGHLAGMHSLPVSRGAPGEAEDDPEGDALRASLLVPSVNAGSSGRQAKRGSGWTLYHQAAMVGNAKMMRELLETKGSTAAQIDVGDTRRYTPFMLSCAGGHLECVKLLLGAGCNASLCNDTGRTGRELAEELHREDILGYLQGWGGVADAKGIGAAAAAAPPERARRGSRGEKPPEKRARRKSEGKAGKEKKKSSKDKASKSAAAKTRSRSNTDGAADTQY